MLSELGLGMDKGQESYVLVGDILDFSFLLIPHNQSISKSVSSTFKACPEVTSVITLGKPLPLLTSSTKSPPPTSVVLLLSHSFFTQTIEKPFTTGLRSLHQFPLVP